MKPDAFCVVSTATAKNTHWAEYDRTEVVTDKQNPEFAFKVLIPYSSVRENMQVLFTMFSYSQWKGEVKADWYHMVLGYASCPLTELLQKGKVRSVY